MIDRLAGLGMNTYLYAPKEDLYHRIDWRKSYPEEWLHSFICLYDYAGKKGVRLIPALAPGLSYDYLDNRDYLILLEKFKLYLELGITHLALLMDDIPLNLPESCEQKYTSLGHAHGELLARLTADLTACTSELSLWFCPAVYSDQFVSGRAVDADYLVDLKRHMPEQVSIMWTGPEIIAETITEENCGGIISMFNGEVIFWDNLYANDYAPLRLFLGPYQGRQHSFISRAEGLLINPTGMAATDLFLLTIFNDFLNNNPATDKRWCCLAREYGLPEKFIQLRHFFWLPHTAIDEESFSQQALKNYGDIYNELIVPWIDPLKTEWFSYLQSLYLDFVYLVEEKKSDWIKQRYPAIIADKMQRSMKK